MTADVLEQDWGDGSEARPKKKRTKLWIALGVTLVVGIPLLCLGAGGILVWAGFGMVNGQIERQLNAVPEAREHLGEFELEMDWGASLEHPDQDVFVYKAKGSLASGLVFVSYDDSGNGEVEINWASLTLEPSGEEIELVARDTSDD